MCYFCALEVTLRITLTLLLTKVIELQCCNYGPIARHSSTMLALVVLETNLADVLVVDPLEVPHRTPLNNVLLLEVSNVPV